MTEEKTEVKEAFADIVLRDETGIFVSLWTDNGETNLGILVSEGDVFVFKRCDIK